MQKQFKILEKEPYKFQAKDGRQWDKCRYKTDSDTLDIFDLNLEVGKAYTFESEEKEFKGRTYTNWRLAKPKSSLELRIEKLEKEFEALKPFLNGSAKKADDLHERIEDEREIPLGEIPF